MKGRLEEASWTLSRNNPDLFPLDPQRIRSAAACSLRYLQARRKTLLLSFFPEKEKRIRERKSAIILLPRSFFQLREKEDETKKTRKTPLLSLSLLLAGDAPIPARAEKEIDSKIAKNGD